MEHVLYNTSDHDAPAAIRDENGEVVLSLCRNCGRGEIELEQPCDLRRLAPRMLQVLEAVYKWWTETPAFHNGEDDMPAEIFDGMRDVIANARGRQ